MYSNPNITMSRKGSKIQIVARPIDNEFKGYVIKLKGKNKVNEFNASVKIELIGAKMDTIIDRKSNFGIIKLKFVPADEQVININTNTMHENLVDDMFFQLNYQAQRHEQKVEELNKKMC